LPLNLNFFVGTCNEAVADYNSCGSDYPQKPHCPMWQRGFFRHITVNLRLSFKACYSQDLG
jgi:hypothetical protein